MPTERAWYRSLYWRIALGSLAVLAVVLALEALVFIVITVRAPHVLPPRALQRLAMLTARELESEHAANPALDLAAFVDERRETLARPIALVDARGRVIGAELPAPVLESAQLRLRAMRVRRPAERRPAPGSDTPTPGGRSAPDRAGELRPRFGLPPWRADVPPAGVALARVPFPDAPSTGPGEPGLAVVVLGGRPLGAVLAELGPWIVAATVLLTLAGTVLAAILVFGPAHRRLRDLENAARRLGAGDRSARASAAGGDEIAAVSATFNKMAAELTEHIERVERSDNARRQLLADVSHELMTPLTAMRGYLETLRMTELSLPPDVRQRHLGIVLEETLRLQTIVGDLLELARLGADDLPLRREPVSTRELLDRLTARHAQTAAGKGVQLTTHAAEGVATLDADPVRLEQALQNLVANALRHTPAGGAIAVTAAPAPGGVVLRVRDTGEGIAPDHLPHVFDRFYRADPSRTGTSGGSGLGLSIVKAIVERHGGTIAVTSAPGRGTEVEVTLPQG
jgi:signal transduction histidine kinase